MGPVVGRRSYFRRVRAYLYYAPHCTVGSLMQVRTHMEEAAPPTPLQSWPGRQPSHIILK